MIVYSIYNSLLISIASMIVYDFYSIYNSL